MVHMIPPILIKVFLGQNSLFIKKSLGKSMIFFLNSFSFSFSDTHIQTGWASFHRLSSYFSFSCWRWGDAAPLARRDLDKLVE